MSTALPQSILRLMTREDRAKLGPAGMTSEEAMAACEIRSEKELQTLLVTWLQAHRGVNRVIRSRMDRRTSYAVGTPDLLFCYEGAAFAWEVKVSNAKLRPAQERAAIAFLKDGWRWAIIPSFAEARAILDGERVV